MTKNPLLLQVSKVFEYNYRVPIYQRNYAWTEIQIVQLIEDIDSSIETSGDSYFLGNLIVNQFDNNDYEVIDGQQRLTRLYLLGKYLDLQIPSGALRFEAREKSNRTIESIRSEKSFEVEKEEELLTPEILNGYQIITDYFDTKNISIEKFIKKLDKVFIVRVQVPPNIDLNHYFEVMNTRGEQLELHEIVKSKLLEVLESNKERDVAALLWEKCSDMNAYVQMNFDKTSRDKIFTSDWSSLKQSIKDFKSLDDTLSMNQETQDIISLGDILNRNKLKQEKHNQDDDDENRRFESTISFPIFLLQVNAVIRDLEEEDSTLDDKNFLKNLSGNWNSSDNAKHFLFHLLKLRVLFDKLILKREFARDYKETGRWSLQRLEKYRDQRSDKPIYLGTLGENGNANQLLRTLQSSLRITYTSPKTMHWITIALSNLLSNEKSDLIKILEEYSVKKVNESNYKSSSGFGFERIVFSYLDYLIYRNGYSFDGKTVVTPMQDNWQFQFRNSIEHYHPQNPIEGKVWNKLNLDDFGNLALITVSGNSRFSNLPPRGKINSYPSIIHQSMKLKIMEYMTNLGNDGWTEDKMKIHREEMFEILRKN